MHSVFVPRIDAFHSVRNGRAVNWHWSSWQKHDRPRYVYDRAVSPDVHSCPTFCFYSFLLPVSIPFPSPPPPCAFHFPFYLIFFYPVFFFRPFSIDIFERYPFSRTSYWQWKCFVAIPQWTDLCLCLSSFASFQIFKSQKSSSRLFLPFIYKFN